MNFFKIKYIFFSVCFLLFNQLFSQVKIGQWSDHLSYNSANSVAKIGSKVYVSNGEGLAIYNEEDNEIKRFTKIDGLSDVGISFVSKCESYDLLFIIYENTNIDIIDANDKITNISDIKRKIIQGKKNINGIYFNGSYAYISCGFGIVVFDIDKKEVKDTYYLGTSTLNYEIYQVTKNDSAVFAATNNGVFYGLKNDNLSYYLNWKPLNTSIPVGPYNGIVNFNDTIIINYSEKLKSGNSNRDTLYKLAPSGWLKYSINMNYINSENKIMYVDDKFNHLYIIDQFNLLGEFLSTGQRLNYLGSYSFGSGIVKDAYYDGSAYWIADERYGLIKTGGAFSYNSILSLNGPETNLVNDMDIIDGNLAVAPIYLGETFNNQYLYLRPQLYKNDEWTNFGFSQLDTLRDINCVSIDPNNKDRYVFGCMDHGVTELNGNQYYNYSSVLSASTYTDAGLRVTSVLVDNNSNIWAGLTMGKKVVNFLKNGTTNWVSLNFESFITQPTVSKLIVDKNNLLWILLARNSGLMVYNDVANLSQPNSSNTKLLSIAEGNGHLPTTDVRSLCMDLDGKIWVGTAKGITVFYNSENIFSGSNWDSQQILIEQDGHVQILLENDAITALAVDGVNRKWVGTEASGIYCFSSDGQEQIYHFTTENSPLYSDNIRDIAVNDNTGDVFFATDKGIQSYRTSIIKGFEEYTKVHCFPNPIKPGYAGNVVITGLIDESQIKIVDVAGNLVWSGKSQGGQIEWNMKTFAGVKAATGTYLIYCSSGDGAQYATTKLLIVN